jgi:mRNA interferase RelE/StbE
MKCELKLTKEAEDDLRGFNPAQRRQITTTIEKFSENPLPKNEGGHGNPLGNKHGRNLTGYCKITLKKMGVRVVYKVVREDKIMKVIVIAARADEEVYDIAANRINR